MKRRSFLSVSALSAIPVTVSHAQDSPEDSWYQSVNSEVLEYKAVSREGNLVLHVKLIKPAEDEVTVVSDEKKDFEYYQYKGKRLPARFWPGCALLTRFDFTWDGESIPIPERFWTDLPGLDIEASTLDPKNVKPELHWKAVQFLEGLRKPRITLSAEGGTALIEWVRPEECDARSTIRWIISKSGTVLRHRDEPPHEC